MGSSDKSVVILCKNAAPSTPADFCVAHTIDSRYPSPSNGSITIPLCATSLKTKNSRQLSLRSEQKAGHPLVFVFNTSDRQLVCYQNLLFVPQSVWGSLNDFPVVGHHNVVHCVLTIHICRDHVRRKLESFIHRITLSWQSMKKKSFCWSVSQVNCLDEPSFTATMTHCPALFSIWWATEKRRNFTSCRGIRHNPTLLIQSYDTR